MAPGKAEYLSEIFQLLTEQRELLKHWPYSSEQISTDKRISARIRELVDRICIEQSPAHAPLLTNLHV
jgi:hypothetical protein